MVTIDKLETQNMQDKGETGDILKLDNKKKEKKNEDKEIKKKSRSKK